MIAHVCIADFPARVFQLTENIDGPVIIRDRNRIVSLTAGAREEGLRPGQVIVGEQDLEPYDVSYFYLPTLLRIQEEWLKKCQKITPIAEPIALGEFLLELDDPGVTDELLEEELEPTISVAQSGWLARIIGLKLPAGSQRVISEEDFEETIKKISVDEIWGLGKDFVQILKNVEIKTLGELYYQDEIARRKLLGAQSRLLDLLFKGRDPRPVSPFSRPRSLSFSFDLKNVPSDKIHEKTRNVTRKIINQLNRMTARTHRLKIKWKGSSTGKNQERSRIFPTPTRQEELLLMSAGELISEFELENRTGQIEIALDAIVSDLEHHHMEPQEELNQLEILD